MFCDDQSVDQMIILHGSVLDSAPLFCWSATSNQSM